MHPGAAASACRSLAHGLSRVAARAACCASGTFHVTPERRSQVRYRAAVLALAWEGERAGQRGDVPAASARGLAAAE